MPQPLQIRQCHPRLAEPGTPRTSWPSCVQRTTSAARPVELLGSCQRHPWGLSHGGTDGPITPCCRRITPWPGKGRMPCTSGSWATTPCMLGAERGAREKASLFSGGKVCEGLRTRPSAFCSAGSAGGSTGNAGSTGSTCIQGRGVSGSWRRLGGWPLALGGWPLARSAELPTAFTRRAAMRWLVIPPEEAGERERGPD